jgi:site-specific recombinase XerD
MSLSNSSTHRGLRALIAVTYTFGFRIRESSGLSVRRVDMKQRIIALPTGTKK